MPTADDVVRIAEGELDAPNGEKYWDWYFGGGYVNGSVTPYCAAFVSWVLSQAGVECPHFPCGYAFDERSDFEGRRVDKYDLEPGDAISFDWDWDGRGDHVGIVTGRYDWGVSTIEANSTGGPVSRQQRTWDNIICGIRPYYTEEEEDIVTNEDIERIAELSARKCAEYVYGDEDKGRNLNNYNALHWGFKKIEEGLALLRRIAEKVGA